jgi:hypothetical protein
LSKPTSRASLLCWLSCLPGVDQWQVQLQYNGLPTPLKHLRRIVRLRNNELYRITYILCIWNLSSFGRKILQNNHANSSGKFRLQKIRQIGFSLPCTAQVASESRATVFLILCLQRVSLVSHTRAIHSELHRLKMRFEIIL